MKAKIAIAVAAVLAVGQLPMATAARKAASADRFDVIAVSHLVDHRADYDLVASDVANLRMLSGTDSSASGAEMRYLRQTLDGLDVLTGDVTVAMTPAGGVLHVGSNLISNIESRASGTLELDAPAAARAAAAHLGLAVTTPIRVQAVEPGPERNTMLSTGGVSRSPILARLVYQPAGDKLRLAWELDIDQVNADHWWSITIDAQTGAELGKSDYFTHEDFSDIKGLSPASSKAARAEGIDAILPPEQVADGSKYRVYPIPRDNPMEGDRVLVENPADEFSSPFGWHDVDGIAGPEFNSTEGNNVHAYADFTGPGHVATLETNSSDGGLTFDHPIDFSLPPFAWRDAAVTNLFYWNNVIHDVFYRYGFDEKSGNFQENNYGRGIGVSGSFDSVVANAQDTGGVNNANFATPTDGSSGRMQMYLWAATAKRQLRDGDLDSGIIIHEYGHGISIRLTGGRFNSGCLQNNEQGGEGWSDFFAIAMTAIPEEQDPDGPGPLWPARRGVASYSDGQDSRSTGGIRPSPYWVPAANPKYDAIKTAAVPHGVGWVWAAMLWDVFWGLADEHGFNTSAYADWTSGGNNRALQLVVDGLKMQKCSPGFVDARNAILAASDALTGTPDDPETEEVESAGTGEDNCIIWKAFARRGLGLSANQGSSASATDGTQAFDVPAQCQT